MTIASQYFHSTWDYAIRSATFRAHMYGIRQRVRKHHTGYWTVSEVSDASGVTS